MEVLSRLHFLCHSSRMIEEKIPRAKSSDGVRAIFKDYQFKVLSALARKKVWVKSIF